MSEDNLGRRGFFKRMGVAGAGAAAVAVLPYEVVEAAVPIRTVPRFVELAVSCCDSLETQWLTEDEGNVWQREAARVVAEKVDDAVLKVLDNV